MRLRLPRLDRGFFRLESAVSVGSIAVGVFLVATTLHLVRAIDGSLAAQLERVGSRTVFVTKFEQGLRLGRRTAEERRRRDLTFADADALRVRAASLDAVSPEISVWTAAEHRGQELPRVLLVGGTEDYMLAHNAFPEPGRFITPGEVGGARRVCVVGDGVARALFGDADPLGAEIELEGERFRVVGVARRRGSPLFGRAVDHFVLVPVGAFRRLGLPKDYGELVIAVHPREGVGVARAMAEIRREMRAVRHLTSDQPDDFAVTPQTGMMELYRTTFGAVFRGIVVVSGVSFLVGAMGILTLMLLVVTERTAEIGLRRAVGARRSDIFTAFLFEGGVIAALGGLAGALASLLVVSTFSAVTGIAVDLSPLVVGVAVLGAGSVGLASTSLPAWRAAQLEPAVALRHE